MTDDIDHAARILEIEARLADGERTGYLRLMHRSAPDDLRYLLDRIEALEEALGRTYKQHDTGDVSWWWCGVCDEGKGEGNTHAPDCIVLTLPAPVEANKNAAP